MKFDHIIEFKKQILETPEFNPSQENVIRTTAFTPSHTQGCLAVGYTKVANDNFRLEIRVYDKGGLAFQKAQKIAEKAKGEVHIAIIEHLEFPNPRQLLGKNSKAPLGVHGRPLIMGMSIGTSEGGAGTLGCFIKLSNKGDALLTASHVLTKFSINAQKNEPVFQPGKPDVKQVDGDHRIAALSNWKLVSKNDRNELDAAAATLEKCVAHEGNILPDNIGCPDAGKTICEYVDPKCLDFNDSTMAKVGRTTHYTEGTLGGVGLDGIKINDSMTNDSIIFDNLISVEWTSPHEYFSQPGDSGSLVYRKSDKRAVGILFAGGVESTKERGRYGVSYICPLKSILDEFNARLV